MAMPQFYLWAYPDGGNAWIPVGWVEASYQKRTYPYGYNDVTPAIEKFPLDDSGWWYAQPAPGQVDKNQMGRYEKAYYSATLPGMTRQGVISTSVI
jgi:hypothetical protein